VSGCKLKYKHLNIGTNVFIFKVTEKEIFNGILRAKKLTNNVLCFIREIDDIEENISSNIKLAKRFIEIDDNGNIDESPKSFLNALKYDKIPSKLGKENIFRFNVRKQKKFILFKHSKRKFSKRFLNR